MMKGLSKLLKKGNLTPKERHILFVANMVSRERTGKPILSEAELYALKEGWEATIEEAKEYNEYSRAWRTAMYVEADAQITYLKAKVEFLNMLWLLQSIKEEKLKWGLRVEEAVDSLAYEIAQKEGKKETEETRKRAWAILQEAVDRGELRKERIIKPLGRRRIEEEIITGESLYNSRLDYAFVREYREYVENIYATQGLDISSINSVLKIKADEGMVLLNVLPIFKQLEEEGIITVDLKETVFLTEREEFIGDYGLMLGYKGFFDCLSKAYKMDLAYNVDAWLADLKDHIDYYNVTLGKYLGEAGKKYLINPEEIKPNRERVEPAYKELREVWGGVFND